MWLERGDSSVVKVTMNGWQWPSPGTTCMLLSHLHWKSSQLETIHKNKIYTWPMYRKASPHHTMKYMQIQTRDFFLTYPTGKIKSLTTNSINKAAGSLICCLWDAKGHYCNGESEMFNKNHIWVCISCLIQQSYFQEDLEYMLPTIWRKHTHTFVCC